MKFLTDIILALKKQYQTQSTTRLVGPSIQIQSSIKYLRPAKVVTPVDPEENAPAANAKAKEKPKPKGKKGEKEEPPLEEPKISDNPNRTRGMLLAIIF